MPDDLASQWKAFSPEQRDQALSRMSPDQKQQLATSLGYQASAPQKSLTERLTEIQPHKIPRSMSEAGQEVLKGVGNIGATAINTILHPVDTITGAVTSAVKMSPPVELYHALRGEKGAGQEFAEQVVSQPLETAEQFIGQAGVTEGLGEAIGPMTRKLKATSEGIRKGVQSAVGAGEKSVKTVVAAEAKGAGEAAKATEEKNRAEIKKHDAAVAEAGQKDVNAHVQHVADRAEAEQANQAAEAIPNSRAGLEKVISDKSWLREQKIAEAEKTAKADLDKRYEDQRKMLGDETIPPSSARDALTSRNISERAVGAFQSFITNPDLTLPKAIKSLADRAGDLLGWRELSGVRSELTKQLSTGKLSGEMFQGYKAALGVVDDGLQKIADNHGVGDVVKKNRADYAHFAQTFYDSIHEPNTVARKTQTATSPDYTRTADEAQRREALNVYDKKIGQMGSELDSLNSRLSSLPSEATRPKAKVPDYPKPTEVTPPNTKPIEVPEIDTRKLREDLVDKWAKGEASLNKFQVSRLVGSAVIGTIVGTLFGHGIGAEVGSAASLGSYALSPALVARIVEKPGVREWLTRPPVDELEGLKKVPYADRIKITDGLGKVVSAAQKQGIKVDPALVALTVGVAGPKTKALQQKSAELRDDQR